MLKIDSTTTTTPAAEADDDDEELIEEMYKSVKSKVNKFYNEEESDEDSSGGEDTKDSEEINNEQMKKMLFQLIKINLYADESSEKFYNENLRDKSTYNLYKNLEKDSKRYIRDVNLINRLRKRIAEKDFHYKYFVEDLNPSNNYNVNPSIINNYEYSASFMNKYKTLCDNNNTCQKLNEINGKFKEKLSTTNTKDQHPIDHNSPIFDKSKYFFYETKTEFKTNKNATFRYPKCMKLIPLYEIFEKFSLKSEDIEFVPDNLGKMIQQYTFSIFNNESAYKYLKKENYSNASFYPRTETNSKLDGNDVWFYFLVYGAIPQFSENLVYYLLRLLIQERNANNRKKILIRDGFLESYCALYWEYSYRDLRDYKDIVNKDACFFFSNLWARMYKRVSDFISAYIQPAAVITIDGKGNKHIVDADNDVFNININVLPSTAASSSSSSSSLSDQQKLKIARKAQNALSEICKFAQFYRLNNEKGREKRIIDRKCALYLKYHAEALFDFANEEETRDLNVLFYLLKINHFRANYTFNYLLKSKNFFIQKLKSRLISTLDDENDKIQRYQSKLYILLSVRNMNNSCNNKTILTSEIISEIFYIFTKFDYNNFDAQDAQLRIAIDNLVYSQVNSLVHFIFKAALPLPVTIAQLANFSLLLPSCYGEDLKLCVPILSENEYLKKNINRAASLLLIQVVNSRPKQKQIPEAFNLYKNIDKFKKILTDEAASYFLDILRDIFIYLLYPIFVLDYDRKQAYIDLTEFIKNQIINFNTTYYVTHANLQTHMGRDIENFDMFDQAHDEDSDYIQPESDDDDNDDDNNNNASGKTKFKCSEFDMGPILEREVECCYEYSTEEEEFFDESYKKVEKKIKKMKKKKSMDYSSVNYKSLCNLFFKKNKEDSDEDSSSSSSDSDESIINLEELTSLAAIENEIFKTIKGDDYLKKLSEKTKIKRHSKSSSSSSSNKKNSISKKEKEMLKSFIEPEVFKVIGPSCTDEKYKKLKSRRLCSLCCKIKSQAYIEIKSNLAYVACRHCCDLLNSYGLDSKRKKQIIDKLETCERLKIDKPLLFVRDDNDIEKVKFVQRDDYSRVKRCRKSLNVYSDDFFSPKKGSNKKQLPIIINDSISDVVEEVVANVDIIFEENDNVIPPVSTMEKKSRKRKRPIVSDKCVAGFLENAKKSLKINNDETNIIICNDDNNNQEGAVVASKKRKVINNNKNNKKTVAKKQQQQKKKQQQQYKSSEFIEGGDSSSSDSDS